MIIFPYNTSDFAFTLDDVFLQFSTATANTYFDLEITIEHYDFFSDTLLTKVLEYKVPLFNQAQKYNVGRKIDRYLKSPANYSNTFGFQFKTANVSFLIKEILIADGSIVDTITRTGVKFIPGPRPVFIFGNNALLSSNKHFERVTKDGFFIANFLLAAGEHEIFIKKNNLVVDSQAVTATSANNVFSKKIDFKTFNAQKGDVFEIQLNDSIIKKKIVVFPDNLFSNHLVFIDKNNLFKSLECTGHFSYVNEYSQIKHEYKRNLVEILEIVNTETKNNFKINTGWLLKSDTETIDAFMQSKKAYLVENNEVFLTLIPLSKKITAEDSDKELYAYELEFQINPSNA